MRCITRDNSIIIITGSVVRQPEAINLGGRGVVTTVTKGSHRTTVDPTESVEQRYRYAGKSDKIYRYLVSHRMLTRARTVTPVTKGSHRTTGDPTESVEQRYRYTGKSKKYIDI
jgi:hypothetical protein